MEELLDFFKKNGVALQITLDINKKPTVHAIPSNGMLGGLQFTDGETVLEALENMKEKFYKDILLVKDKVLILGDNGDIVAKGTIVNINEYREPSMMYAVDVVGYVDDVLFYGESQLLKYE